MQIWRTSSRSVEASRRRSCAADRSCPPVSAHSCAAIPAEALCTLPSASAGFHTHTGYRNRYFSRCCSIPFSEKRGGHLGAISMTSAMGISASRASFASVCIVFLLMEKSSCSRISSHGFSPLPRVTVTITSFACFISSAITRFCTGVKPVNPSNTITLSFNSFDCGTYDANTSSDSSVVRYFSRMNCWKPS